ncbi:MAG TPA: hypothetical protein DEF45_05160 [Rhodopirellula sp.]|nr:hypothetical protein [Rhodopirellula sp.]
MITEDRDLMQDAIGPQVESDRRKVRIDFEAGRATSRSASGLFLLRFKALVANACCPAGSVMTASLAWHVATEIEVRRHLVSFAFTRSPDRGVARGPFFCKSILMNQ